jgi:hypothetical protein
MRLSTTCTMLTSGSRTKLDTQHKTRSGRSALFCWGSVGQRRNRKTFDCTHLFDTILDRIAWHAEQNREHAKEMARDGLSARAVDVLP